MNRQEADAILGWFIPNAITLEINGDRVAFNEDSFRRFVNSLVAKPQTICYQQVFEDGRVIPLFKTDRAEIAKHMRIKYLNERCVNPISKEIGEDHESYCNWLDMETGGTKVDDELLPFTVEGTDPTQEEK